MNNQIAIKIEYFALGITHNEFVEGEELYTFRREIQEKYISTFEIRHAERGGSNFIIEFLYNISLEDFLSFITSGIAWDVIKAGSKSFVIRPFIELYKKFRKSKIQEIRDMVFRFNDSKVIISPILENESEVDFEEIGKIFRSLTTHYDKMQVNNSGKPVEIYIPIIKDEYSLIEPIFRTKLDADEPLSSKENYFTNDKYYKFWGIEFNNYQKAVYDLENGQVLLEDWYNSDSFYDKFGSIEPY